MTLSTNKTGIHPTFIDECKQVRREFAMEAANIPPYMGGPELSTIKPTIALRTKIDSLLIMYDQLMDRVEKHMEREVDLMARLEMARMSQPRQDIPSDDPDCQTMVHPLLNDPEYYQTGLTKREYFAARAMNGFLTNPDASPSDFVAEALKINKRDAEINAVARYPEYIAKMSIRCADALINELKKTPTGQI